jgi:fructokinase
VIYAGIELGGTKCVLILARGPDDILARHVVPTGPPAETLQAVEAKLLEWQQARELAGIGIAAFGPLDLHPASPTFGHVRAMQKPGWDDVDLLRGLKRSLTAPVAIDTDVNGAALAEMRWGSGRGFRDFAYITVGTGVGVGVIVDGKPIRGIGHSEFGHIRVARLPGAEWAGSCPFHRDCVEGLASGSSLRARFGDKVEALGPDDGVWEEVVWTIAQLCHAIVCATAPHRIVIGGGVMAAHPDLLTRIEQKLLESLNGFLRLPEDRPYVSAPGLGTDAGPLGALALAMRAKP